MVRSIEPLDGSTRAVVRGVRRVTPCTDVAGTPPTSRSASARPIVIKIGGRSLEAPGAPGELAAEIAKLGGGVLLVHGGGSEVSAWCARLGIDSRFENGLRVTDPATLEVSVAVLAGLANQRLVATLRAAGVDAAGLSGADGGVLVVEPHPQAAQLGRVGTVRAVDARVIDALLAIGVTPVLSSIAAHRGELLNVNADEAAGAIAGALGARDLVLLSDTPALLLDGVAVPELARDGLEVAIGHASVQGGMIPKLAAARTAIDGGAARVTIAAWQGAGTLAALLAGEGTATRIVAHAEGAAHV